MKEQLGLDDATVAQALAEGRDTWDADIDQVYYRFDRKPLSPEALTEARAVMQAWLDAGVAEIQEFEKLSLPPEMAAARRKMDGRSLPYGALFAVVKKLCNWPSLPPELAGERDKGTAAQLAASESDFAAPALEPLRFLLEALAAAAPAAAGVPPGMEY